MMNSYKKDIVKFIQKLVQTPSVNGVNNEIEIVKVIEDEVKKLDLPYKIITKDKSHPNIFVGNNFNKKEGLLLVAHLDTAGIGDENKWSDNPFSGKIIDNKLYGRGSIDNKAGIALSVYTLKVLKDQGKLDFAKFVGVADEERGADSLFGARHLLDLGLQAKSAIYTYSGNDTITIGHRGQVKLWIEVSGESAHSGSKGWQDGTKGASAIEALNKILINLQKIKFNKKHSAFPGYGFKQTVLYIQGGAITSLVPDKAKCLIDARLLPNHLNKEYIGKVINIAKSSETDKIKTSVEVVTNLPGAYIDKNEKIVKILQKLTKNILNKNPEIRGCGPANEGYMFIGSGIPTICGFGVDGEGAHSKDEYLDTDSIDSILKIYIQTAIELQ